MERSLGMTTLENLWVLGIVQDLKMCELRLDHHQHFADGVIMTLGTQGDVMDRSLEMINTAKGAIRRLYTYLAVLAGVLVMVMGLLVWSLMR